MITGGSNPSVVFENQTPATLKGRIVVRKNAKKARKSGKKLSGLSLIAIILATTTLVVGAATVVISRQSGSAKSSGDSERKAPAVANQAGESFVTVKVAGQDVQVDGQTGRIKELTPEEAQRLATGLKQLVNKSDKGLSQVHHNDGSVSVNLEGRYQSVTLARVNDDGTVSQSCVDNPRAAAAFFGINPRLIENAPETPRQPVRTTPEN